MINNLTDTETFNVIYFVILLAFFGSSIIARLANRPVQFLKDATMWLGIIFVLVLAYSYRYEFSGVKQRLLGELSPARPNVAEDGTLMFKVASDGHYHILAEVNGAEVEFMVDTGASDVVITKDIAKKIGIDMDDLSYDKIYSTANGTVQAAPIIIEQIKIGGIKVENIRASVSSGGLDTPLLGMSFLDRLTGYEVRSGVLSLRP
jgi:aspartyl protease family protein